MKKVKRWVCGLLLGGAAFLVPVQVFAAEENQTLGQKMAFAAQNTVIGISIVFGMLLLMILVIYCFRFLPKLVGRFTGQNGSGQEQEKTGEVTGKAAGTPVTEQATAEDDAELVAVITAAIAAARAEETSAPVGSFVVRTIKRRA